MQIQAQKLLDVIMLSVLPSKGLGRGHSIVWYLWQQSVYGVQNLMKFFRIESVKKVGHGLDFYIMLITTNIINAKVI